MDIDISNHVILDSESYAELQTAAWDDPTLTTRILSVSQTTLVFAAISGAYVAGAWGVAKVQDWAEERTLQRRMREKTFNKSRQTTP